MHLEIHYQTHVQALTHDWRYNYKLPTDMMRLQSHLLLKIGYVTVRRVKTLGCAHCVELTLIRARCPPDKPESFFNCRVSSMR
jgi:hypothetical protein